VPCIYGRGKAILDNRFRAEFTVRSCRSTSLVQDTKHSCRNHNDSSPKYSASSSPSCGFCNMRYQHAIRRKTPSRRYNVALIFEAIAA
jgi:hypothetical protein